jgi:hypothetical protein
MVALMLVVATQVSAPAWARGQAPTHASAASAQRAQNTAQNLCVDQCFLHRIGCGGDWFNGLFHTQALGGNGDTCWDGEGTVDVDLYAVIHVDGYARGYFVLDGWQVVSFAGESFDFGYPGRTVTQITVYCGYANPC